MAISPDLIEAFNNCIDLLHQGETIESVLSQYPTQASQLRPMLEAGQLFPRVRYSPVEVGAAQTRIEPRIQEAVESAFGGSVLGSWPGLLLIAAIIGGGLLVGVLLNQPDSEPSLPIPTVTMTVTETLTPMSTQTATLTMTLVATSSSTQTTLPSDTPTMMATQMPTQAQIPSTSTIVSAPPLMVVEGPVESIDDDGFVIFDTKIEFNDDDDPRLAAIQIGDVIRIEGEPVTTDDGIVLVVINLIFVDSDVHIDDSTNEIWRDDGNCANPPPPWAPAHGWRRRCEGGGSNSGVNPGNNNDDDDDNGGDDDD